YSEWLFLAEFALAQGVHGALVGGAARQVISAQTLDRNNLPFLQQVDCLSDRIFPLADFSSITMQAISRTATGTGYGLGMKAPVVRIVIFTATTRIERPGPHRRVWTIV